MLGAVARDARALRAARRARRAGSGISHAPGKIAAAVRRPRRRGCSAPLSCMAHIRGTGSCSGGPPHPAAAPRCSWAPARCGGALSAARGRCGALGRRICANYNQGALVPGNARALRAAACSWAAQRRHASPPAVVRSQAAPHPRQAGQWRQGRRPQLRRLQRRRRRARPPDRCRTRRSGRPLRRHAMRGGAARPGTANGERLAGCVSVRHNCQRAKCEPRAMGRAAWGPPKRPPPRHALRAAGQARRGGVGARGSCVRGAEPVHASTALQHGSSALGRVRRAAAQLARRITRRCGARTAGAGPRAPDWRDHCGAHCGVPRHQRAG